MRVTYLSSIHIEQWATEKEATEHKEGLERANPGDGRRRLILELMSLVILLEHTIMQVRTRVYLEIIINFPELTHPNALTYPKVPNSTKPPPIATDQAFSPPSGKVI
jgi:hypothetical protein